MLAKETHIPIIRAGRARANAKKSLRTSGRQIVLEGANSYTQYLTMRNSHGQHLRLHIEPWGEELLISPNAIYQIVAEGPVGGCLEIEFAEAEITAYGWPGSILSVFQEHKS